MPSIVGNHFVCPGVNRSDINPAALGQWGQPAATGPMSFAPFPGAHWVHASYQSCMMPVPSW
jgi:hypothetical protein